MKKKTQRLEHSQCAREPSSSLAGTQIDFADKEQRERKRERDAVNRACVCLSCRCPGVCACVPRNYGERDRQTDSQRICKRMNSVLPL